MAYELVSTNLETYGPTVSGLALIKKVFTLTKEQYANEPNMKLSNLDDFLTNGITSNPKGLAVDCNLLIATLSHLSAEDGDKEAVQSSLSHLAEVAMQAKEGLALTC